jgi:hypothetical protein
MTRAWLCVLAAIPSVVQASPQPRPNSERPPERNPAASTGRSGNATLTARALRAKTGVTELEVTTGALDTTTPPPGVLSSLRLKAYTASGDDAWTKTYAGLTSGYVRYTFEHLVRGAPLELQANIRGIDGDRTSVITLPITVKARPDPAVERLEHSPEALIATPVVISALVRERNGDTTATTNCFLEIDGVRVDDIRGAFVAGGQSANCIFSHAFETAGVHTLRVTLDDVVPADDDLANNAATSTISIRTPVPPNPAAPVDYYIDAYDHVDEYAFSGHGWWDHTDHDGTSGDWSNSFGQSLLDESAFVYALSPRAASWPIAVSYRGTADGVEIHQFSSHALQPTSEWSDGSGNSAATYLSYEDNLYVSIDSSRFNGTERTLVQIQRWAGQVRFFSHQYERTFNAYTGETYFYVYDDECCPESWEYSGQHWTMNESFAASLQITDASGTQFIVEDVAPMTVTADYETPPYEICQSFQWEGGTSYQCNGGYSRYRHIGGFVTGHSGP